MTTYVKVPPEGLVVSLSEAKGHLRIDAIIPGTKSSLTIGTGDSEMVVTAHREGEYGDNYTAEIVVAGTETPLSVTLVGRALLINSATDGSGDPTSTVNDVIAYVESRPLIANKIDMTSGDGSGTGILEIFVQANLDGGVDGISDEDTYVTGLLYAAQEMAENFLRKKLLTQTLGKLLDEFCNDMVLLPMGPVQEVVGITYIDAYGTSATVDPDLYRVEVRRTPQYVKLHYGISWPDTLFGREDAVEIEYVTGYGTGENVPAPIRHAILFMVGHFYSNREAVQIGPGIVSLKVPQSAEWLLWPYRDFRF